MSSVVSTSVDIFVEIGSSPGTRQASLFFSLQKKCGEKAKIGSFRSIFRCQGDDGGLVLLQYVGITFKSFFNVDGIMSAGLAKFLD